MDENKFSIKKVKIFDKDTAEQIKKLAQKLSDDYQPLSDEDVQLMIHSSCNHLYVARDHVSGKIVGMATLIVYRIPYTKKSIIEDVIVDEQYRGQGVGSLLLNKVIEKARDEKVAYVDLTSRPSRKEGNMLYMKLGFEKRDTNVYRLKIDE